MKIISTILLLLLLACSSQNNNTQTNQISFGGYYVENTGGNINTSGVILTGGGISIGGEGSGGTPIITGGSISTGGTTYDNVAGGSSIDFAKGGRSTVDIGYGGGSSIDIATGGSWSIDIITGGGSSIDVATGGGSSIDIITGGGSSIDVTTGGGSSIDQSTGGAPSIDLGCKKTALTNINVYVIKDATPTGADTEGNMYVGGDLITSNYAIGKKDIVDCTQYALVVRGDVTGALVYGGKAISSGTISNTTAQDCGIVRGKLPVDFDLLETQVNNLSSNLSKLPSNGIVSGSLKMTGNDPVLNVFNITANQLNTTQVSVTFPQGSSVVVNVSGASVNWANGSVCLNGQCDDSTQADYVLWNFYEATSIYMSGIAIEGSVLAPLATLKGDGGHIAGQIIVQYLTGGLEYHPYYFNGCLKY